MISHDTAQAPQPAQKRLATATACAACAGYVLRVIDGDDFRPQYVVTRQAHTCRFSRLEALESWLLARVPPNVVVLEAA